MLNNTCFRIKNIQLSQATILYSQMHCKLWLKRKLSFLTATEAL